MIGARVRAWLWPAAGFMSMLVLWVAVIGLFHVKSYIIPEPWDVGKALIHNLPLLLDNVLPTAIEAICGFFLGNAVGIVLAIVFVHSDRISRMYFPVAVLFNTVPIIAISPIFIIMFGLSIVSKIVIAAMICLFPSLVNMIRGFQSVTSSELELMRVNSASAAEVFFHLRLPKSIPYLFSALRITCVMAVVGALVSEWIGAQQGIGVLIIQSTFDYRTELLYSAIIMSSSLALAMFGMIVLVERRVLRRYGFAAG